VSVLKANGAILFFRWRHPSAGRLLICCTAAKYDRTRHYHKNGRALQESPKPCGRRKTEFSVHLYPHCPFRQPFKADRRDSPVSKKDRHADTVDTHTFAYRNLACQAKCGRGTSA
jgi:hypothetical protein